MQSRVPLIKRLLSVDYPVENYLYYSRIFIFSEKRAEGTSALYEVDYLINSFIDPKTIYFINGEALPWMTSIDMPLTSLHVKLKRCGSDLTRLFST